tara:strand:- start:3339 stop:4034 length:696 start_codon:yes stop_codon:yes gene_type:complete
VSSVVAIIPCRGGSKGLPGKNIKLFSGKPLLAWTLEQLLNSKKIDEIYVSSDNKEILDVASEFGSDTILRPDALAADTSSSESVWLHAIEFLDLDKDTVIIAPQVTSPLRLKEDFSNALDQFTLENNDSLFSCSPFEDICLWSKSGNEANPKPVNFNYRNRSRRQELDMQIVENGSFYIFRAGNFKEEKNRIFGKVGFFMMKQWQVFEIDDYESFLLCENLMKYFVIGEEK